MQPTHKEILSTKQIDLLPFVHSFSADYILVGGTAIALYLGHRESIDFDLFNHEPIDQNKIKRGLKKHASVHKILVENSSELTAVADGVKMTWYDFPYQLQSLEQLDEGIGVPSLIDLGAMKLLALGGRAKWKDYVDLYFILRDYYSLGQLSERAEELFGGNFNGRLVREQLTYYGDVDYREEVVYQVGFEVDDEEIKEFLQQVAIS